MEVESGIGALQLEVSVAQIHLTLSNLAMVDGAVGNDKTLAWFHYNRTTCRYLEHLLEDSHSSFVVHHISSSPSCSSCIAVGHCDISTSDINSLCRVVVEFDVQVAQIVLGSCAIQTGTTSIEHLADDQFAL